MKRAIRSLATVSTMSAVIASAAGAQIAMGSVIDSASGAPIRGAFVMLLDASGRRVAATLSGARGEFAFRVQPGRYSLRADLIGHRTTSSAPFELLAARTRQFRLAMTVDALRLDAVSVVGERRCATRPDQEQGTARLWGEVRKALAVAAWVEQSPAVFRLRTHTRKLDPELNEVAPRTLQLHSHAGRKGYYAVDHDSLARHGYVQDLGGERVIFAPDADVLLSDDFLDRHCFRIVRSAERPGLIGLGFEPTRQVRLPDIRGALWIDTATLALRFLEFTYTGPERVDDGRHFGGRLDFEQLANGAWIVRGWYVRAPVVARPAPGGQLAVVESFERGGEVLDVMLGNTDPQVFVPRFTITGIVFDSINRVPLAGASIYLSGTGFQTVSDSHGQFRLDSVPAGPYLVGFSHASFDALPFYPEPRLVDIGAASTRLALAVPSPSTVIGMFCSPAEYARLKELTEDPDPENVGLVYGTVRDAGSPLAEADVQIRWRRVNSVNSNESGLVVQLTPHALLGRTDARGRYLMCGAPIRHPIRLELRLRDRLLVRDTARLAPPGLYRRDFNVNLKGQQR